MKNVTYNLINNYKQAVATQIDIKKQQDINNLLLSSFQNQNQNIITIIDRFHNFSSDWEDLETRTIPEKWMPEEGEHQQKFYNQFKTWTVEYDFLDIRLLPFFDAKFLYRRPEGNIAIENKLYNPIFSIHSLVEDNAFEEGKTEKDKSPYNKKVTIVVSFYLWDNRLEENYQVKLNLRFINPRKY